VKYINETFKTIMSPLEHRYETDMKNNSHYFIPEKIAPLAVPI